MISNSGMFYLLYVCVILCVIFYHVYNLKNMKNTHGEVFFLVKVQYSAFNFNKNSTRLWVYFTFFKLCKWYQIAQSFSYALQSGILRLFCSSNIDEVIRSVYLFFMIKFHKHKKEYKALKSTTILLFINSKFIDIRFIDLKFIDTRFIDST